jgi:hypothetical protein
MGFRRFYNFSLESLMFIKHPAISYQGMPCTSARYESFRRQMAATTLMSSSLPVPTTLAHHTSFTLHPQHRGKEKEPSQKTHHHRSPTPPQSRAP